MMAVQQGRNRYEWFLCATIQIKEDSPKFLWSKKRSCHQYDVWTTSIKMWKKKRTTASTMLAHHYWTLPASVNSDCFKGRCRTPYVWFDCPRTFPIHFSTLLSVVNWTCVNNNIDFLVVFYQFLLPYAQYAQEGKWPQGLALCYWYTYNQDQWGASENCGVVECDHLLHLKISPLAYSYWPHLLPMPYWPLNFSCDIHLVVPVCVMSTCTV